MCLEKSLQYFRHNFIKYWPLFKILTPSQLEICSKTIIKYPTTPRTPQYTTVWNINVRNINPVYPTFDDLMSSHSSPKTQKKHQAVKNAYFLPKMANALLHRFVPIFKQESLANANVKRATAVHV